MTDLHDIIFPSGAEPARSTGRLAGSDRPARPESPPRQHARPRAGAVAGRLRPALRARPPIAVGLTVLAYVVLGLLRSFVPHGVGLADSGAGGPVACALGVVPDGDGPRYTSYAILRWVTADVGECADAAGPHLVALTAARWASTVLGAGALDLRVLLVAYCLLAALLATLVGRLARGRRHAEIVAGALTWVVLMDVSFLGYAASLYPQGVALAGLVVCVAGLLLLDGARWRSWAGSVALVVGGSALVSSSTVAALAVLPVVVVLVGKAWRSVRRRRRGADAGAPSGGLPGHAGWIVPTAAALVLLVPAMFAVTSVSEPLRKVGTWELVSLRVLADEPEPGPELESMGLPAEAARFVGIPVWSPSSVQSWSRWSEVEPDQAAVLGYVAARPALAFDLLDDVVRAQAEPLPAGLGSYDAGSGAEPGAQDGVATVFSRLQGAFLSWGALGGLLVWAVLVWVAAVVRRGSEYRTRTRRLAATSLTLLGVTATQVVGTALTEGTELSRQVVAGNLAGGLAVCLLIAAGLAVRSGAELGAGASTEAGPKPADVGPRA
ncbi:hypothetical protein [Promicromonospora sp. NPDC019610]|uniref:glycan biosynthesis hexose transferase WsfD n=1 Tax=Promicromonospora sp. NPDC019610 TaxID=3364405 RepID=UPI003798D34B